MKHRQKFAPVRSKKTECSVSKKIMEKRRRADLSRRNDSAQQLLARETASEAADTDAEQDIEQPNDAFLGVTSGRESKAVHKYAAKKRNELYKPKKAPVKTLTMAEIEALGYSVR